ncbi:MAG: RAMP superfamily CRISPR-associated protein [Nitrososphaerales archaeon]
MQNLRKDGGSTYSQPRVEKVQVIRSSYTPRHVLAEGRFNAKLVFVAEVPKDSFLFVWAGDAKSISLARYKDEVSKNLHKPPAELIQILYKLVNKIESDIKGKKISGVRTPPSYGADKQYYIPASSIKGALRSRLEYKFKPKEVGGKLVSMACYSVQGWSQSRGGHIQFWGKDVNYQREGPCNASLSEHVCVVCDLFGARSLASRVDFSDLKMVSGTIQNLSDLNLRVYGPEDKFSLSVVAHNANWVDLGLLLTAMELKSGSPILIGAKKYVYNKVVGSLYKGRYSFGLLKFSLEKAIIFDHTLTPNVYSINEFVSEAFKALEKSQYDKYLDYEKGVLRLH